MTIVVYIFPIFSATTKKYKCTSLLFLQKEGVNHYNLNLLFVRKELLYLDPTETLPAQRCDK